MQNDQHSRPKQAGEACGLGQPEPLPVEEDDLTEWLAAWDDQLAEGSSVTSAAELGAPPALAERLEREAAFCQLVRRTWAHASGPLHLPMGSTLFEGAAGAEPALEKVGRFELRRELGRGAFGVVYLAYDPRLRRELALKVPRAEVVLTPQLGAVPARSAGCRRFASPEHRGGV